jgi:hypothetical protein
MNKINHGMSSESGGTPVDCFNLFGSLTNTKLSKQGKAMCLTPELLSFIPLPTTMYNSREG